MNEKEAIKDNYDLINSKAIGNYCRQIGHKFIKCSKNVLSISLNYL